jgi:hypothetical protein
LPFKYRLPARGAMKPPTALSSVDLPARRPQQHEAVAPMDVEADVVGRAHDATAIARVFKRDVLGAQQRLAGQQLEGMHVHQLPPASAGLSKK